MRIETAANGAVVMTNQSHSLVQRLLSAVGLRRRLTAEPTPSTSTGTTGNMQVQPVAVPPTP